MSYILYRCYIYIRCVVYCLFSLFQYRCLAVKTARGPISDMCLLRPRRMLAAESSHNRESAKSGSTIINFDLLTAAVNDFQLQHNKLDCQKCFITLDIVSKKGLSQLTALALRRMRRSIECLVKICQKTFFLLKTILAALQAPSTDITMATCLSIPS